MVPIRTEIEDRAFRLAIYMIENGGTVRAAAARYGVSKSTVHKDLTRRLPEIDPVLYRRVKEILDRNKAERHLRGGAATRRKYKGETGEGSRPP